MDEKYDFNRRGWAHIYPPRGDLDPAIAADIKSMGFIHRNEHPQLARQCPVDGDGNDKS